MAYSVHETKSKHSKKGHKKAKKIRKSMKKMSLSKSQRKRNSNSKTAVIDMVTYSPDYTNSSRQNPEPLYYSDEYIPEIMENKDSNQTYCSFIN